MKQQNTRKAFAISFLKNSPHRQRGASALEYIVLAAVIVIAVVAGAILLGGAGGEGGPILETFEDISKGITGEGGS